MSETSNPTTTSVENNNLCRNQDCHTINDKTDDSIKCEICDGYFYDNGLNDILFIQEEPNVAEWGKDNHCRLCGNRDGVVMMKRTYECVCEAGCNESGSESE